MPSLREAGHRHAQYYLRSLQDLASVIRDRSNDLSPSIKHFNDEWLQIKSSQIHTIESTFDELCCEFAACANLVQRWVSYEEAERWLEAGVDSATRADHQEKLAFLYRDLAAIYFLLRKYLSALECDQRGLQINRVLDNKHGMLNALIGLYLTHKTLQDQDEQEKLRNEVIELVRKETKIPLSSRVNALTQVDFIPSDEGEQITFANRIIEYSEVNNDPTMRLLGLETLASMYTSQSKYQQAIMVYQQGVELCSQSPLNMLSKQIYFYGQMGFLWSQMEDAEQALQNYHQALNLAERIGDKAGIARLLQRIADVHMTQKNFDAAIHDLKRAIRLYRAIDMLLQASNVSERLGTVFYGAEKYEEALKQFESALSLYEPNRDKQHIWMLHNLGRTREKLGQYKEAINAFQEAATLSREIHDYQELAYELERIGEGYHKVGDPTKAIQHYQQALQVVQERGETQKATLFLMRLAELHLQSEQFNDALQYGQQAGSLAESLNDLLTLAYSLCNVGYCYGSMGSNQQAENAYTKAYRLFDTLQMPDQMDQVQSNLQTLEDMRKEANS